MNKLQHTQLQALTAINSQLDTIPQHVNDQNIDSLVNGLKSRRRLSFQLQSTLRPEITSDEKNLNDVLEVEDTNDSRTIGDSFLSSKRSSKISNRNTKDLASSNGIGELDRKYLSAEPNSDSENTNEMSSNLEDRDDDDLSVRRRRFKNHPTLTINTSNNSSHRLITPESSDSEFDISTAHMPLAPTLGEGRNPLRVARNNNSSVEIYKNDRRGNRPSSMIFNSMDEVIEEEGEITEQKLVDERSSEEGIRVRDKQTPLVNGRKHAQKYMGEYDIEKSSKINLRTQMDESYAVADAQDDNCSVISSESLLEEIGVLRSRIQRLESEHANLEDDPASERKQRRKRNVTDSSISPSAVSPSSSQGGASSSNTSTHRRPSTAAQHNRHLQNAFDFFEKAFATSDQYLDDSSPPPSHSMAMVVSSALMLNTKLRGTIAQMDDKTLENSMKVLLKTSDEQIRSLTECILALSSLAPKKQSKRIPLERDLGVRGHSHYPSDSTFLQMPTPAHSTRSVSPIPRISSATEINNESQNFVDQMDNSTHRVLPTDQQSPYYSQPQRPRYNRVSRPPSPVLPPENINDPPYSQFPSSRVLEYRSRRISIGAYGGSYSGTQQNTSPSPPPPSVLNYDASNSNGRVYYDRGEISRLQKYGNQSLNNNTPSSTYQRINSRPSSYIRTEEPMHPTNHARNTSVSSVSSLHRSSSGRSYALRGGNDEFTASPASTTSRQQPRMYEYARRYPSDKTQTPIEKRQTPMPDMERRYVRRGGNNLELEGYDLQNGYGEHIIERDYMLREEKPGLRRNDSNSSTSSIYRPRLVPPLEDQEIQNNGEEGSSEESRSIEDREDDLRNNVSQDLDQTNGTSNNNIIENG
ncbi:6637_t:CDS:2 [Acaulospora colombiana]|uniref:6637_t:CDS:1 n=1 Tax=Acaulospora colombiana TaxID=27376 RepID=A0ACA9JVL7_9GLOM|nr:6637_t:CDS:2 [Acaulospora colombiana]